MSRVCKICGGKLGDDDNYCIICNRYVDAVEESEYGMDKSDKSPYAIYNKTTQPIIEKKSNVSVILAAIVGILIIIGTVYYLMTFEGNAYGNITDKYYKGMFEENYDSYRDCFFDKYYIVNKDAVDDIYFGVQADMVDGSKMSYSITSHEKLSRDNRDSLALDISKEVDSDIKLSKAYELEITIKKNGTSTQSYTEKIYVVRIDGKNYIYR